jgi:hypothetical protein
MFRPSVDRAGRRYPIVVYTVLEPTSLGAEIGYLPNAMAGFLTTANELVDAAATAPNVNAFLAALEPLRFVPALADARKEFGRFVLVTNALKHWGATFGNQDDPRRYAAVGGAVEGAGTRPPAFIAMRMPFSGQEVEVAFWLELSRRLTDGKSLPTLMYWNHAVGDHAARLHIAWGELSARVFLPFVLPNRSSLNIRDLCSANTLDGRWVEYGKTRFDELLNNPSLKLTDLLQRLPRSKA